MATFTNARARNTTSSTTYTCSNAAGATIIGLTVANTHSAAVTASVAVNDGNDNFLIKDAPISVGSSMVVVGGDQKVVLQNTQSIKVTASNNVDVVVSILEI
jgi:hypothetical protein